ncbi:AhpC/TSA family protein [Ginsengibacter hankyongi]|uniref:AhpC/TSA family protein n=1 Tax=Ginsengibacter hankyongi TaxID=2607284 RepID=A0A5J5IIH1_9BACT|nr:TlpA disulfide reductase family protein [Ginsengibacter hankyongi]KAA9038537.1 AhpC/TSA family protein [Ginsengibacter hankyongi]
MKVFILGVFNMVSIFGMSQTPINKQFILTGVVHGRDTGFIVLRYINKSNRWIFDSTYLQNGRFRFEGKINEPTSAVISGKKKIIDFDEVNYVNIFLEPDSQHIELTENDYIHAKVIGSAAQNELDTFNLKIDSINAKYKIPLQQLTAAKYAYQKAQNEKEKENALQKEKEISGKLNPRYDEVINEDISFLLHHPDSYVSPFIFYAPANILPIDSAITLFHTLSPRIQNSISGKYIADLLRKKEQNTVGKTPYDFNTRDINGHDVSLSKFRGRYLLIDFWASWCAPCVAEIPNIKKLYEQYHVKRFDVLSISIDKDSVAWRKAVTRERISNWQNIRANEEIANNYPNVNNPIPSGMLIGPNGKIIWKSGGDETLGERLKRMIK